jgi:hypothetical protein
MESPSKQKQEPRTGDVSWVSLAVCVGILVFAAYNAWGLA